MKFLLLSFLLCFTNVTFASFSEHLKEALGRNSVESEQADAILKDQLADFEVLFVGFNDKKFIPLQPFRDNIEGLKQDLNVDSLVIKSNYCEGYIGNGNLMAKEINRIYAVKKKSLIVIGNPQSGPDVLYALLKNPELFTEGKVAKLILLQPAFGSPLMNPKVGQLLGKGLCGKDSVKFGLEYAQLLFSSALSVLTDEQRIELDSKLYYVRSETSFFSTADLLRPSYLVLKSYGKNDGISLTSNQKLDGVGIDLGVISADHWDLFASMPVSNTTATFRRVFTKTVLSEVLKP